jgi:hypothetical protein
MKNYLTVSVVILLLVSCSSTTRLVDFTVISSKNHAIHFDLSQGKPTTGESIKFWGSGANIKDAMDEALQNAGPQYDVLVNGVVRQVSKLFSAGYEVEGVAINSRELIALWGEDGYVKWLAEQQVFDPNQNHSK